MSEAWSQENHEKWKKAAASQVDSLVESARHQPPPSEDGWGRVDEAISMALRKLRNDHGCPEALMYLEHAMESKRAEVVGVHDARVPCEDVVVQTLFERVGETGLIAYLWKTHKANEVPFQNDRVAGLEEKLGIPNDARHAEKADRLFRTLRERRLTR